MTRGHSIKLSNYADDVLAMRYSRRKLRRIRDSSNRSHPDHVVSCAANGTTIYL